MKILFVSLFLPQQKSRHAGGRYVYEILRNLAQRHEIHLATRLEESELPLLDSLRPLCATIHPFTYPGVTQRGVLESLRLVGNYLGFSRFADRLIRSGEFDVVQVEWVETALLICRGKTPMVLDAHDVITKPAERRMQQARGAARLPAGLRYLLTRAAERRIMRRFAAIFTVSEFDRHYLLRMAPELAARVKTVPIPAGMDISGQHHATKPNTILFLAAYRHRQVNVDAALWFYREVLPLVRRKIPEARFIIAGNGPPEELTMLAAADPKVEVPGFVDDIDRCYKEAAVFVAPILTGGGIIVKILDALAAARPVVATSIGNEGIAAQPGRDLLVADDPATFAAHVVKLLQEPEYARTLGANGAEFVKQNYGIDSVIARLENNLAEVAKMERQKP
ncbi:MAG TPA: glycosyltransferase family 4 protein [Desulfuromonadales bacterium]|nr:glycosyltransferase family 4 protein [Desulfuromonadales bacterium]